VHKPACRLSPLHYPLFAHPGARVCCHANRRRTPRPFASFVRRKRIAHPLVNPFHTVEQTAGGAKRQKTSIKLHSRRSTIVPDFVGYTFAIHNGIRYKDVTITEKHVGHKFAEFAITKKRPNHPQLSRDKKK
jgi:small subunit ribosomal protein S19